MIRRTIGTVLWILAMGVTAAIIWNAMGTQDPILTVIGVIGIIAAGTGIYLAMDAAKDRAPIAFVLSVMLWLLGEAFVVPSEVNYWSAKVTAKAEREVDLQRQANARRMVLDATATKLASWKPERSSGAIQAAIDQALAKTYRGRTLAELTNGCTNLDSGAIGLCKGVLALRAEKAVAAEHEHDTALVWDANTAIGIDTSKAHGASDGAIRLADMLGGSSKSWNNVFICTAIFLLFFARGLGLYIGWRPSKSRAAKVAAQPQLTIVPVPGPIPAPALTNSKSHVKEPIGKPVAPIGQPIGQFEPDSIEELVQTVSRTYEREGRTEVGIPEIRAAIGTLANARGLSVSVTPQRIGAIVSARLGYRQVRRGTRARDNHRWMIYDFTKREGVATYPRKQAA